MFLQTTCQKANLIMIKTPLSNRFLLIKNALLIMTAFFSLASCSVIEKSSMHGFDDGYYKLKEEQEFQKVYLDVSEETVTVYPVQKEQVIKEALMNFPQSFSDSLLNAPVKFRKTSLDIDITSVLLKYRPNTDPIPSELTAELNIALYAGPRFDRYALSSVNDPIGNRSYKVLHKGFDFGALAGIGTTSVNPFSTQNKVMDEYNGMFFQTGVAGFLETSFASFGLSLGYDFLMTSDKNDWIYNNKPWIGFVIGIALN
jgi:hypothetical protein